MTKPEAVFKLGSVEVAVWQANPESKTGPSLGLKRNYRDKEGDWKSSPYLRTNDIPKAIVLLQKAYEQMLGGVR